MDYPKEFVEKTKALLPKLTELHEALDRGDLIVGRYLDEGSSGGILPTTVINFIESNKTDQLLAAAKSMVAQRELYSEWAQMVNSSSPTRNPPQPRDRNEVVPRPT